VLSGNGGLDVATARIRVGDVAELSRRRTIGLIAAVRDHQTRTANLPTGRRPHDLELYARAEELLERSRLR
jgi:hypothetical protein